MYDFECTKCAHKFEDIVPSTAANPPCPQCASPTEKVLSVAMGKVKKMSAKGRYYLGKDRQKKLREKAKKKGTALY